MALSGGALSCVSPPASIPYRCGRQWGPYRLLSGDASGSLAPGQQSPLALGGLVFLRLPQLVEAHTPGLVLFVVLPPLPVKTELWVFSLCLPVPLPRFV